MEKLIAIVGTTASGKSDLGILLAQKFNGEIVSCDSRQVYRGLDLGSGKVTKEEQTLAVHHLLDVVEPGEKFSVAEFQALAYAAIEDILSRGKLPILVGGTGLYVRAITEGYVFDQTPPNPKLRAELEKLSREELIEKLVGLGQNRQEIGGLSPAHLVRRIEKSLSGQGNAPNQPRYKVLTLGLTYPREVLKQRIRQRIDARLNLGMIEEVQGLLDGGVDPQFLDSLGLEYRYISRYLLGKISYEEFYSSLAKDTDAFAKRQMTWFRKDQPIWVDPNNSAEAETMVEQFLKQK